MGVIRVSETMEIPITEGTIEVDTSQGPVTLFLKPAPGKRLTISKISTDSHTVTLYCEKGLIGRGEIVIFGVPRHSRARRGHISTLSLRGEGQHWAIVAEN